MAMTTSHPTAFCGGTSRTPSSMNRSTHSSSRPASPAVEWSVNVWQTDLRISSSATSKTSPVDDGHGGHPEVDRRRRRLELEGGVVRGGRVHQAAHAGDPPLPRLSAELQVVDGVDHHDRGRSPISG